MQEWWLYFVVTPATEKAIVNIIVTNYNTKQFLELLSTSFIFFNIKITELLIKVPFSTVIL